MARTLLSIWLAACVLAPGVRADVMNWHWQVEVNGRTVDATRPIAVRAGDHVDLALWGAFEPHGEGFAVAEYAIATGEEFFRVASEVNIDPDDGYGPNPVLDAFGYSGTLADSDGDGKADTLDEIAASQMPPWYNAEFDASNPLFFYRIGWTLGATPSEEIRLWRADQLDGGAQTLVFQDIWGDVRAYENICEFAVFMPAPASALPLAAIPLIFRARRRAPNTPSV